MYHQISLFSLFVVLYVSNFNIDMLLFCQICLRFIALFRGFSIFLFMSIFCCMFFSVTDICGIDEWSAHRLGADLVSA